MSNSVQATVGNAHWVLDHYVQVRNIFPAERTLVSQQLLLKIGFAFKVAGVDWRSQDEMSQALVLCQHLGMFEQELAQGVAWIQRSQALRPPPSFFHMSPAQIQINRLLRCEPSPEVQDLAAELLHRIMYPQT